MGQKGSMNLGGDEALLLTEEQVMASEVGEWLFLEGVDTGRFSMIHWKPNNHTHMGSSNST